MKLRLRVTRALVLPAVLLALFTHHPYRPGGLAYLLLAGAGMLFLLASAGGRIWAGTNVVGRKNRSLVSDGPYSLTSNPLYFFSLLGFIGAGLSFGSFSLAALFALCFFGAHWPTIAAEERRLAQLFGDRYRAYRAGVPRFLGAQAAPDGDARRAGRGRALQGRRRCARDPARLSPRGARRVGEARRFPPRALPDAMTPVLPVGPRPPASYPARSLRPAPRGGVAP